MGTSFHVRLFPLFFNPLSFARHSPLSERLKLIYCVCVACARGTQVLEWKREIGIREYEKHTRIALDFSSSRFFGSLKVCHASLCRLSFSKLKYVKSRIKDVENNRLYGFYSFHPVASRQHVRQYDSYTSGCTGLKQSQYTWR